AVPTVEIAQEAAPAAVPTVEVAEEVTPAAVSTVDIQQEAAPVAVPTVQIEQEAAPAAMPAADSEGAAPSVTEAPAKADESGAQNNGVASIKAVLVEAGMELIETKSAPAPVVDVEPVRLGRARKPAPQVAEEPLQQVETH